jgi:hypothetical protein
MTARKRPNYRLNLLLAGGLLATLFGLMTEAQIRRTPKASIDVSSECASDAQSHVVLTEEHLASVLAVSERESKDKIRAILEEPYCTLPTVEIRAGVNAEREVYPLAFNDHAWLILLFEGDEYAGYRISSNLD